MRTIQSLDDPFIPKSRFNARQLLLTRGLMPMLSAPPSDGLGGGNEADMAAGSRGMLEQSIRLAAQQGMIKADDHVVCVQVGRVGGEVWRGRCPLAA